MCFYALSCCYLFLVFVAKVLFPSQFCIQLKSTRDFLN
jgi:hypothetical protein